MHNKTFNLKVYTLNKQQAEQILDDRSDDLSFQLYEAGKLSSLQDLVEALEEMPAATFLYHANKEKNDFANWVRSILGDERLADLLKKSSTQEEAAQAAADRLQELRQIAGGEFI